MKKVLFVCIHNSARSQMAESFLSKYGQDIYEAYSAGIEPGAINPLVAQVMEEIGIDFSKKTSQSVEKAIKPDKNFDYIITVCDEASAEKCPLIPGIHKKLHWSFEDPSALSGPIDEKLHKTRIIRDEIKKKILDWIRPEN